VIQTYEGLDALPKSLRIYGASDYATMAARAGKREPDKTEHGVMGVDKVGDFWFVDWWTGQTETDVSIAQFIRLVAMWKPIRWANEGGLIDKAIGPAIRSAMQHSQKFVAVEQLPSLQDKAIKLQAFHARVTAGTVHFPVKRRWADECIEDLIKFPGGRWDDKPDVCGLLGRLVDQMVDARVPSVERKPLLVPFTEKWLEFNDQNQKPSVRYF
jgi:predicted phage terminase large subunit-like protein